MVKQRSSLPRVSIVICTLNCKDDLKVCLESIKKQDYPKKKLEVIIVDSYSSDGTIELAKSYGARVVLTKIRGYMEGRGMPKAIGCEKAKGEIIITIDSDNALVEKDWISKVVKIMKDNKEISFCISRMKVVKTDSLINKYLSMVGTDPFTIYGSFDPQFTMGNLKLKNCEDCWIYENAPQSFWVVGGHYNSYRRSALEEIGGYMRDVDNNWMLTKRSKGVFAIPKNHHVHHRISDSFKRFFKQKIKWAKFYFEHPELEREFNWQMGWWGRFGKVRFYYEVIKNLIFFPEFLRSLWLWAKTREKAWVLHAPMKFGTTMAYLIAWLEAKR